ncbi:MAG: DUF1028 domain-containing protein [Hyphomicrobiaceae bacterium]|nr:DUF1028 domain-containing protein [Hyphomicrobiaceae bacterium]
MTWSIIARDEKTRRIGIAVATCAFAVGARVPHIRTGVGAIATQAMTNVYYGPRGLALLAAGATADDCVRLLLQADEGRDHRQVHAMDRDGRLAARTGSACVPWCGHLVEATFSVAGNMLAGPEVIHETAKAYAAHLELPFARRLIAALRAGEAAGGDKRGKQSAAMLIHDGEDHPALDLRVDDHRDPIGELARIEAVSREMFVHTRRFGPTRDNPAGMLDPVERQAAIERSIREGYE